MNPQAVPVIRRSEYDIGYQQGAECIFVHVDVRRWSTRIRRKFMKDVKAAHAMLDQPVYAVGHGDLDKQAKFVTAAGFIRCGTVESVDTGEMVPIWVRPIKGQTYLLWEREAA